MTGFDPKVIEALPYEVLSKIPGGTPPPGVQPLSPNPESFRLQNIVVGSIFLGIATIFVGIRAYIKLRVIKRVTVDDYVCAVAYSLSCVQFSGIILAVTAGAGGYHMWDSSVASLLSRPNILANWITTVFGTPALGFAKLTFFIQYYNLFWPLRWCRLSCWIGGGSAMAFYFVVTITMAVLCSPWPNESWIASLLSTHYADASKLSIPTGTVGAIVDIFLLVLPIRAVMSLQLSRNKRLGLIAIFLTGSVATIASIVGVVYRGINQLNFADAEWGVAKFWLWLQIELFAGISCSCMPSLSKLVIERKKHKLFSHSRQRLLALISSKASGSTPNTTGEKSKWLGRDSPTSKDSYAYSGGSVDLAREAYHNPHHNDTSGNDTTKGPGVGSVVYSDEDLLRNLEQRGVDLRWV